MSDLTSIINTAVSEATSGGDIVDTGDSSVDTGSVEAAETTVAPESTEATTVAPDTTTPPTADEVAELLNSEGVKPPVQGQRENRIPYSQVRKIVENARKKQQTEHEAALKARNDEFAKVQEIAQQFDSLNKLATNDPERYMAALAAANPVYAEFKRQQVQQAQADAQAQAQAQQQDPMPQPDARYADGTKGYSQDGLDKLLQWNKREGVREAQKEFKREMEKFGKQFEPIAREYQAHKEIQAKVPIINAQLQALEKIWGPALQQNEQAIIEHNRAASMAARQQVPIELSVAAVLLPKIQQSQQQQREALIKEMNARPAATTTTEAAATKTVETPANLTMDDVIKGEIAKARTAGILR